MKKIFFLLILLSNIAFAQQTAVVYSAFEGGNCQVIDYDKEENELYFTPALGPKNNTSKIWYFFEVLQIDTTRPFTLYHISNNPLYFSANPIYSYDKIHWYKLKPTIWEEYSFFGKTFSNSKVYFATGMPYLYSDLQKYLKTIKTNSAVELLTLSQSRQGRDVPLLIITDTTVTTNSKKLIWIIARQHAFEAPANFCLEGLINYLISNQPEVIDFRKKNIVYIVPMVDVDNVAQGGTGRMQLPVDYNRDWSEKESYWQTIQLIKELIEVTAQIYDYKMFLDLHATYPSAAQKRFMYININKLNSKQSLNLRNFWALYKRNAKFAPKEILDYTKDNFADIYNKTRYPQLDFSQTIECTWYYPQGTTGVSTSELKAHGNALGKTIVDYMKNKQAK